MTTTSRCSSTVKPRPALNAKYEWKGLRSDFEHYKCLLEGYLLQVGARYITSKTFPSHYETYGGEYLYSDDFWTHHNISPAQARYDRQYLYGILVSTNRKCDEPGLLQNDKIQDGVKAWLSFLTRYDSNAKGKADLKVEKLELNMAKVCTATTADGFLAYLDQFEADLSQLEALCPNDYNDSMWLCMLILWLCPVPFIAHLLQTVKDQKKTYD